MGPPTGLAVDGNQPVGPDVVGPDRGRDPILEALLKRLGLERDQQSPDAIARGDSIGERKELGQPIPAILGPAMDGRRPIAATDHPADRDHHDVHQEVLPISRMPRVGERLEVGTDRLDVHPSGRHARHPGRRQAGPLSDP